MNSPLEGYAHYQAVRVDGEPERIEAKAEDGSLVFEAGGPGRYAVLGSDTPCLLYTSGRGLPPAAIW